jgi:hypothetical protein
MTDLSLAQALSRFAHITQNVPDAALERAWAWRSYDSEGIRFAFFRTYEELRELAVRLHQERGRQGQPVTHAQRILGHYHAAYLDLQGALLGMLEPDFELSPAEEEWPLRKVLVHIVSADLGFYVVVRYALDRLRHHLDLPIAFSDQDRERISGLDKEAFYALMDGPVPALRAAYAAQHQRVLADFAGIRDAELEHPSTYWENEPMRLQFRLHRFESHLRQHTIQVDKTLAAIKPAASEARRLLRLIYSAQAEVESVLIGAQDVGVEAAAELAKIIAARSDEIAAILAA